MSTTDAAAAPRSGGPIELGAFLRARRAGLDPAAIGVDPGTKRRVRGLRREEVAQLAAISTDYYARLEQGRLASASGEVLDALAIALRLGEDERSYLYQLANKPDQHHLRRRGTEDVRPQTRVLLENLRDSPALVLDRYLDVLAWNPLASAVFKDFATVPREHRSFVRMLFLDAGFRDRFLDWEPSARAAVGFLRAATPHQPRLVHLIDELSRSSADFRDWWTERHVSYTSSGTRTYDHPLTGPYVLDWQLLLLPADDQLLMVYTAPPDTPSVEILQRLA